MWVAIPWLVSYSVSGICSFEKIIYSIIFITGADNFRDVAWLGDCDEGCFLFAEKLGWKVRRGNIYLHSPSVFISLHIDSIV